MFQARTPAGRFGKPEEVAHIAVFLASDEVGSRTSSYFYTDKYYNYKYWPPTTTIESRNV